jgi:hypothetical protein
VEYNLGDGVWCRVVSFFGQFFSQTGQLFSPISKKGKAFASFQKKNKRLARANLDIGASL